MGEGRQMIGEYVGDGGGQFDEECGCSIGFADKNQILQNGVQFSTKCRDSQYSRTTPEPRISATTQLLQVSDINHQLNVNKKYQHLGRIKEGVMVGQGFKRTFAYDCLTTPHELAAKRKEFWETRVNGSAECWGAIRIAVEQPNQETGYSILQELRISMLNGNIQMCVDTKFNKYQVPVFCINDPLSYAQETIAQKNLNFDYSDESLQVKVRSVRFPTEDILLAAKTSVSIGELKRQLRQQKSITDVQSIRFFYNGREMIDDKTLGNYSYAVGTIIQGMIR